MAGPAAALVIVWSAEKLSHILTVQVIVNLRNILIFKLSQFRRRVLQTYEIVTAGSIHGCFPDVSGLCLAMFRYYTLQ